MKEEFVIYVLYSFEFDKIYIGYTSNIIQRIFYHNNGRKGYTQKYRPWAVIHIEFLNDKSQALKREKLLKGSKGRQWIKENFDKSAGFLSV